MNLNKSVNEFLSCESSYKDFSRYFHFLLSFAEISKSSSGALSVSYPAMYNEGLCITIFGYDTLTLSRQTYIECDSDKDAKEKMIELFEIERKAIIKQKLEDEEEEEEEE